MAGARRRSHRPVPGPLCSHPPPSTSTHESSPSRCSALMPFLTHGQRQRYISSSTIMIPRFSSHSASSRAPPQGQLLARETAPTWRRERACCVAHSRAQYLQLAPPHSTSSRLMTRTGGWVQRGAPPWWPGWDDAGGHRRGRPDGLVPGDRRVLHIRCFFFDAFKTSSLKSCERKATVNMLDLLMLVLYDFFPSVTKVIVCFGQCAVFL